MARAAIPQWTLGDRLEKALDVADVSVGDMARELNVTRQSVGNYLSGRTKPQRATVILWAAITGVDAGWLLTGREEADDDGSPRWGCTSDTADQPLMLAAA